MDIPNLNSFKTQLLVKNEKGRRRETEYRSEGKWDRKHQYALDFYI